MKTKPSKPFLIALGSLFALVFAVMAVMACSWWEEPDNSDFSVFAPEIIQQPAATPFFLSYHFYYGYSYYGIPATSPNVTERNTEEWFNFFEGKLSHKDVHWLIYKSSIKQVQEILQRNKGVIPDSINQHIALDFISKNKRSSILQYILLAKQVENIYNPDYDSWDAVSYDSIAALKATEVCRSEFFRTSNKFLKNRYGFQITRALSIAGKYDESIQFFDNDFKPTPEVGSMYYRSLGYKARSLYKMKNYALANYYFSRLFETDLCSRYQDFQSFHPQEEKDWNATLLLAKNTHEKEILWHLLGLNTDPVRAMKEIYRLNPQSELLSLLLVRSVNMAEQNSLSNPQRAYNNFYSQDYFNNKREDTEDESFTYLKLFLDSASQQDLLKLINDIISEKKVNNLHVWQLSFALIQILNQNFSFSTKMLGQLTIDKNDTLMVGQAEIIKGVLAVKRLTSINDASEKEIYEHINSINQSSCTGLRSDNAVRYMLTTLSTLYQKQGNLLKKELTYPQGNPYYTTTTSTQEMIDFIQRKDLNSLESYLVRHYVLSRTELHDIKAVNYIYDYNFDAALQEYKKGNGGYNVLNGNPFTIHLVDCHDCDHSVAQSMRYTNSYFSQKMIELKAKGDTMNDPESRAQNYFLYANGLYNMTWYGNARAVCHTAISGSDWSNLNNEAQPYKALHFFDCNPALMYYQKAAELSRNREFKAKCTWMSAKCEQNIWLESEDVDPFRIYNESDTDFTSGKYFAIMKNEFPDTKYYTEAINECGYFCTYITHAKNCIRNPD